MASRPERIAIIDDTYAVRSIVARRLESIGYTVLTAADGEEGLELIRNERLDLVLCDLRMPKLDGLALLKAVKARYPDLPILVMSGAGLLEDAVGALKLGAWDYIMKPVERGILEHSVKSALEKAALIEETRRHRANLEKLNGELRASLRLLAEDEDAGRQIQFRMLPRNHQRFGEYHFTREVIASAFLSGDFIDAFHIDRHRWGFYLADVSGHGVSSALVTVLLRTFVQRQAASFTQNGDPLVLSPARLLSRLNEDMAREDLDKHLTIFYGVIDLAKDTLVYANAGHFPWPVLRNGHEPRLLQHPGVPVGMTPSAHYQEHGIDLGATMRLAVFSDGLLEAIPSTTLAEKLDYLKEYFGGDEVTIEKAKEHLHLGERSPLPDDVAILIIERGGSGGNTAHA